MLMISIPKCFSIAAQHVLHHENAKLLYQMSLISQLKGKIHSSKSEHQAQHCLFLPTREKHPKPATRRVNDILHQHSKEVS